MLILSRKVGQEIVLGDGIRVKVASVQGDKVRLAISAPPDVVVDRLEIHERRLADRLEKERASRFYEPHESDLDCCVTSQT